MVHVQKQSEVVFLQEPERRQNLWDRVQQLGELLGVHVQSPVIPLVVGDEATALTASAQLLKKGFHVPAIRPPTVPKNTSRSVCQHYPRKLPVALQQSMILSLSQSLQCVTCCNIELATDSACRKICCKHSCLYAVLLVLVLSCVMHQHCLVISIYADQPCHRHSLQNNNCLHGDGHVELHVIVLHLHAFVSNYCCRLAMRKSV